MLRQSHGTNKSRIGKKKEKEKEKEKKSDKHTSCVGFGLKLTSMSKDLQKKFAMKQENTMNLLYV